MNTPIVDDNGNPISQRDFDIHVEALKHIAVLLGLPNNTRVGVIFDAIKEMKMKLDAIEVIMEKTK